MTERSSRAARRPRHRRRRRSWLQRLVLLGGALSTVALAGSAGSFAYLYRKAEQIPRVELSSVLDTADEGGEPENYLIVGIDNADRLAPDDPVRRRRDSQQLSDTIMVLRIDPSEKKAELLSLPRDLWVPYGDTGDHARINAAISRGNGRPDVLIGVLRDYFGIPIHHYVQLDLAGFRDLVTAIDGVPVYFPYPARDQHSGLSILETGCVTLDPVQALAYARSRYHDELIDGEWVRDPRYDLGRIARQQEFIRSAMNRAVSKGARNPGTLDKLLDAALGAVTIDDSLTTGDLFDLADRFRSFEPDSLETFTVPVDPTYKGAAAVVLLREAEAEPILARFRGDPVVPSDPDSPVDILPASVRLTVSNGSGEQGQASEAADQLTSVGFIVVGRGDESGFGFDRTVIRYPAGNRPAAELVARWLVAGADLEEIPEGSVEDGVVVVTGADWEGVRTEPSTPLTSDTTSTTDPDDTDETTSTTSTTGSTTTTTLGDEGSVDSTLPDESTTTTSIPPEC